MVKAIALLRKKAGISREEMIAYYETRHAPLVLSLLPQIAGYRRSYPLSEGAFLPLGAELGFDVMTELRFASRADYEGFLTRAGQPEVAQAIADDEENFLDRSATRMVVVEEHGGDRAG
ncbi:MAG: EthD domain-containing protein [Novosphingobium sp.]